jgi:dUTP pyrophosphatase
MKINIKKLNDAAILPSYQSEGAAGMDLHACIKKPIKIGPNERTLIPTGIAIEVPVGYEAQVRARSGLAHKYGISLTNGIGTIDADYRGEVGVLLINLGEKAFIVEPNMRIAQLVLAQYEKVTWNQTNSLTETTRNESGFGSSGS